jgi:hypothetical protein
LLISPRPPLQYLGDEIESRTPTLHLAVSASKELFEAKRVPIARRIKACLKQVVSGLFSGFGFINKAKELEIVKELASECYKINTANEISARHRKIALNKAIDRIHLLLQALINPILDEYLRSIQAQIFDPKFLLKWNFYNNNCQILCESLIQRDIFKDFVSPVFGRTKATQVSQPRDPLYCFSFICGTNDNEGLPRLARPKSKNYAPNGLSEEYLLRFRKFGHHNESDIVDTLHEYWWDWGAFEGTLFPYQDLFPWDCTEAFGTGIANNGDDIRCGECNLTKHAWAFPFDSWSIISLHLLRRPECYQESLLSDENPSVRWLKNRITCLSALHCLNSIAVAIQKTPGFREQCVWKPNKMVNSPSPQPRTSKSRLHDLLKRELQPSDQRILQYAHGRARMAGIFRAQPQSHFFELDERHDCDLSPWADVAEEEQISAYKTLRDARADMLDIRKA